MVQSIGQPVLAAWYRLYLAAIAIDAMCVRRGLTGFSDLLGEGLPADWSLLRMTKANGILGSLSVSIGDWNSRSDMAAAS